MEDNKKAAFRAWFNRKWAEWDSREERRTTQQELADWLGISRSAVAAYTSGKKIAEGGNLRRIARKFGEEVYELFGLDIPPDEFSRFPDPLAERLRVASDEIECLLNSGKFSPNSPEHLAAAREIFDRLGFDLNDIEIEEQG
jgi:transcriptional regulator with XRE-family HTH domain